MLPVKVLIFCIHGIGRQDQDFSLKLRQGVTRKLQDGKDVSPDIVYKDMYWANVGSIEQDEIYRKIYPEAFTSKGIYQKTIGRLKNLGDIRSLSYELIGDIFGYLGKYQGGIRKAVFTEFSNTIREAIDSKTDFSVVIIGHSLGSVIIHDIMSGLATSEEANLGKLPARTSVVTMGSPLALFSLVSHTLAPDAFRKWINIVHPRDPIASPLKPLFPYVHDVPIGSRFGLLLPENHSVYWDDKGVHKLIAEEIRSHFDNPTPTSFSDIKIPDQLPSELIYPLYGPARSAGFSNYMRNFDQVSFEGLIEHSKTIEICNIYGKTWYAKHAQYIARALENPNVDIKVFMLSPESPALSGYGHHFENIGADNLKKRIEESIETLTNVLRSASKMNTQKIGRLRIYFIKNIITHAFYRFDHRIYYTPQKIASNKLAGTPIPVFVFKLIEQDENYAWWIMRDLKLVSETPEDCTLHLDSQSTG